MLRSTPFSPRRRCTSSMAWLYRRAAWRAPASSSWLSSKAPARALRPHLQRPGQYQAAPRDSPSKAPARAQRLRLELTGQYQLLPCGSSPGHLQGQRGVPSQRWINGHTHTAASVCAPASQMAAAAFDNLSACLPGPAAAGGSGSARRQLPSAAAAGAAGGAPADQPGPPWRPPAAPPAPCGLPTLCSRAHGAPCMGQPGMQAPHPLSPGSVPLCTHRLAGERAGQRSSLKA